MNRYCNWGMNLGVNLMAAVNDVIAKNAHPISRDGPEHFRKHGILPFDLQAPQRQKSSSIFRSVVDQDVLKRRIQVQLGDYISRVVVKGKVLCGHVSVRYPSLDQLIWR